MGFKALDLRNRRKNRAVKFTKVKTKIFTVQNKKKRLIRVGEWVKFKYCTPAVSCQSQHIIEGTGKVRRIKNGRNKRIEYHILREKGDERLLICYGTEVWPKNTTQEAYHPERFYGD